MPTIRASSQRIETVVLKLSGSLFFSEEFERVASTLIKVLKKNSSLRLVIVAGGGSTAREYIGIARKLGADQATQDEIGIAVSRVNAQVLAAAMGGVARQEVPKSLSEMVKLSELDTSSRHAVVMGGLHPGQSTNAVGALAAEKLKAKQFLNATDVDAVYSKDPKKYPDAKPIRKVTASELEKILGSESMQAGGYDLMDPIALKLIERSRIPTWIMKCKSKVIEKALVEGKPEGTEIVFDRQNKIS